MDLSMFLKFLFRLSLYSLFALLPVSNVLSKSVEGNDLEQYYDLIYQIKVGAEKAGSKSSIGSGFQISESGLVITNYHVISAFVQFPKKNKITYESHTGETGNLKLLEFDVVNDIALLQHPKPSKKFLKLSKDKLVKGDLIYALGNPSDFGIKLVTGPNNGLADHRYDERILFSASLNGGMSGGPALNGAGEVVGVNVSTAGGQLSFLVPVSKVEAMVETIKSVDEATFQDELASQLKEWQGPRLTEVIDSDWPVEKFGKKELFGQIRSDFTCWGKTNEDDKERRFHQVRKRCRTGNVIYLGSGLNTGNIVIFFQELKSLKLNAMQFSEVMDYSMTGSNKIGFDDSTNFDCHADFLEQDKSGESYTLLTNCIRGYKKLSGLYDSLMRLEVMKNDEAFTAFISIYGAEKEHIKELNRKFVEKVL